VREPLDIKLTKDGKHNARASSRQSRGGDIPEVEVLVKLP
jgi:hypothetical protein